MATRKYDDESLVKAVKAESASREPDEWEKRSTRREALEIARQLSEVGSKADDVVRDAEVYYDYIMKGI